MPKHEIIGPFSVFIQFRQQESPQQLFDRLQQEGRYDQIDRDITLENFPFKRGYHTAVRKNVGLFKPGRPFKHSEIPQLVGELGPKFKLGRSDDQLGLGADKPDLIDEHIYIGAKDVWYGRERNITPHPSGKEFAPHVLCMHKDHSRRRLRLHQALGWNDYIGIVVVML